MTGTALDVGLGHADLQGQSADIKLDAGTTDQPGNVDDRFIAAVGSDEPLLSKPRSIDAHCF